MSSRSLRLALPVRMPPGSRRLRWRRRVVGRANAARWWGLVLAGALVVSAASPALATDGDVAVAELASSSDFRVRVSAALVIGRTHPPGGVEALERALDDGHPTVRAAAAEALGTLGDPAAVGPLEHRLATESSGSVKAQIRSSIDRLRSGGGASSPSDDAPARLGADVRCVVAIGSMRNSSGLRGDDLRHVLEEAARNHARLMRGVTVVREDSPLLRLANARHLPVITLDGNVTRLRETRTGASLQVHAAVEFTVRRDQTLRGTVSGAATTFGSGPSLSDEARRRLEDDAVDGAVQSALSGAEQGLIVAAL